MDEPIVYLSEEQSRVHCPDAMRKRAIDAAFYLTMSPHEHVWSHDDVMAMAAYCLWAAQRLDAIGQCVTGKLEHEKKDGA